eukprot:Sro1826_g300100.1 n/a (438) ;mRNA; r:2317-3630
MYAFIHQSASSMSLDQFKSFFDKDLIEKVGRFQLGQRRWNKLTEDERILETYDILSDSLIHTESLKNSNFDKFLTLLNQTIGGETAQRKLIEGQIRRSLQTLKDGKYNAQTMIRIMGGSEVMLSDCIESAAAKTHALLGGDAVKRIVPDLIDSFCESYQSLEDAAFANLEQDGPSSINVLALPMVELISCHTIGSKLDLGDLGQCAEARMKVLFRRQLVFLLCQSSQKIPTFGAALNRNQRWDLWVVDWHQIWGSILLVASISKHFNLAFGREKVSILDIQYAMAQSKWLQWVDAYKYAPNGAFAKANVCPSCGSGCNARANMRYCSGCRNAYFEGLSTQGGPGKCFACCMAVENGRCSGEGCSYSYHFLGDAVLYRDALVHKFDATTLELEPKSPNPKKTVRVPSSLSSPKHFGHIAFLYCEFMESLDAIEEKASP